METSLRISKRSGEMEEFKTEMKSVISIDDKNSTSIGIERENVLVPLASSGVTASALSSPEMSKLSSPETHTKENTKEKNISSPGSQKGTNEIDPDFGIFWSKEGYPKRVAKGAALRAWNSAKKRGIIPPIEKILEVLKKQKNSEQWQKDNGKFIPHPATWLNQQRWDDELPEGKVTGW
jgi:hypothetical protein